ncbi:hypothetical protein [Fibrella forsythiae]|uniref:Uncharacterized protein n=1 Tax=Fibrella forsythiae TaxID=2817061 RepID=A0ABS3JNH0_9BACT|nr:hypothetical protein [Fibrella forsythiae]MBO0950956.1 hypothetical protein [Fibrella forsythiae]
MIFRPDIAGGSADTAGFVFFRTVILIRQAVFPDTTGVSIVPPIGPHTKLNTVLLVYV